MVPSTLITIHTNHKTPQRQLSKTQTVTINVVTLSVSQRQLSKTPSMLTVSVTKTAFQDTVNINSVIVTKTASKTKSILTLSVSQRQISKTTFQDTMLTLSVSQRQLYKPHWLCLHQCHKGSFEDNFQGHIQCLFSHKDSLPRHSQC